MSCGRMQWLVVLAVLAVAPLVLPTPAARAAEPAALFIEPPPPEVLARILFGPRYRSAQAAPTGDRFGMMINFELDSTRMLPESLPLLDAVGEMLTLKTAGKEVLVIEGHADTRGTHAYNQDLSTRRAEAIKRYLVGSFSVPPARLVAVGLGETRPHDANDGASPINRRAEFRAVSAIIVD